MSKDTTLEEFTDSKPSEERMESPIGEIPTDWEVEWLRNVVTINPDGFSEDDWPSETFEYISLSEVSNGEILGSETIRLEDAPSRAQREIEQGDVLVGTVRPKQRSHGFVDSEHSGKICSSGFGVLRTGPRLNSRYLLQEILSNRFFSQMEAYVAGSGYPAVKIGDLKKHRVSVPPLPEQRKIAAVLYTIDRAIENVNEIKERIERVRAGTAQNLFRNGISQSGTKDTWLGEIPKEWQVRPFSEIVDSNRNGLYKPKDSYGTGHPIAKMGNALEKRTLDMSSADRLELTDEEKEKYKLNHGDLIFARRAQEVSAAGDCCYVPQLDELTVFESSLIRASLSEEANPRFYSQYFDSPVGSRSINRIVTETSISGIATSDLLDLKVAIPSLAEQSKIASIMWQFDEQEKILQREKERYERFKRGLMQDLLSGTVRTTDTPIEVPNEIAQYG